MPTKSIYAQLPLPRDNVSIRLLDICPSNTSKEPLNCRLRVAKLDSVARYEALSYCWGDPSIRKSILIEDIRLQVTANLAAALHAFRLSNTVRTMWVDAICIDQENKDEKNSQIPLMRDIYSRSSTTLIWLGPSDTSSSRAMWLLNKAGERFLQEKASDFFGVKKANDIWRTDWKSMSDFILDKKCPAWHPRALKDPFFSQIIDLLERPWFRRIWIVQEVAVSQSIIVYCGNNSISWDSFTNAIRLIDMLTVMPLDFYYQVSGIAANLPLQILSQTREDVMRGYCYTIRNALRQFQTFESTLPVDKIFALRGLVQEPESITIDYESTWQRVYTNTTARIIENTHDLSVLFDCQFNKLEKRRGLPSWVPDYSTIVKSATKLDEAAYAEDHYCADLETEAITSISECGTKIQVCGQEIDHIALIGKKRPLISDVSSYWPRNTLFPKKDPYEFFSDSCEVMRNWRQLAFRSDKVYCTGELYRDVYWQTVMNSEIHSMNIHDQEKFHLYISSMDWQFEWFDWFVQRVPKSHHWSVIWTLFPPFLFCLALVTLVYVSFGILSLDGLNGIYSNKNVHQSEKIVARTSRGLLAFLPVNVKVGDSVVILKGLRRPVVLRREGKDWTLVGIAYVHGIMYGGAFDLDKCETFTLI